jgi:hypothetical protein
MIEAFSRALTPGNSSGRSATASTTEKIAVVAPRARRLPTPVFLDDLAFTRGRRRVAAHGG